MIARALSMLKHPLHWLHLLATLALLGPVCVALARADSPLALAAAALLGFAQNIGLLHEHFHRYPRGPRWLSAPFVQLGYALGGLNFARGRAAHLLHHANLGTMLDPDRHGYLDTVGLARRLRYLFLIGPLRARFAPVDVPADAFDRRRALVATAAIVAAQGGMLALLGRWYPVWLGALLSANVLSNIREMAEHGNGGKAAHVDVKVTPGALLFFNNPGFWYHGTHHWHSGVHYLELPLASRKQTNVVKGRTYLGYLLAGDRPRHSPRRASAA